MKSFVACPESTYRNAAAQVQEGRILELSNRYALLQKLDFRLQNTTRQTGTKTISKCENFYFHGLLALFIFVKILIYVGTSKDGRFSSDHSTTDRLERW